MSALTYRPCAGVMLVNAEGRVWVGQRNDMLAGAWQMPQGGIDDREAPADAALRELGEETGIAADKVTLVAEAPEWLAYDFPPELLERAGRGKWRGQRQRWFLFRFEGEDADVNIDTAHPEFSAWAWMEAGALVEAAVPFKRDVYAAVLAAFAGHLRP
jgi:putative (di)nucleoside polyphosphate hydrolase